MPISISPVLTAKRAARGGNFEAARIDMDSLQDFISPIVGLDHFRMSGPTFAPHPHAGFSAISYLFEDSDGGLRNRDSLGNDFIAEPGEMIWTQAGSGVIHDELPAVNGRKVHGIQLFVNLSQKSKGLSPQVFQLKNRDIPIFVDEHGSRIRVLTGNYRSVRSPVMQAEPFNLLDASLLGSTDIELQKGWNTLLYVLSGTVDLISSGHAQITLETNQVIGISADEMETINLAVNAPAQVLILSGPSIDEPVVSYGPFIMCSEAEINAALERFQAGKMGQLAPLA